MWTRRMTVGVWALVVASAVAWGLRFSPQPPRAPTPAQAVAPERVPSPGGMALQRLLGANVVADTQSDGQALPLAAARFKLLGVIADYAGHGRGVALIALDDKPAHSFRVGALVDGDLLLQSVGTRTASLGGKQGAALVTLEMPSPASVPLLRNGGTPQLPPAAPMPLPAQAALVSSAPAVAAPLPSVRVAAPAEVVSPGRRLRLRGASSSQAPEAP